MLRAGPVGLGWPRPITTFLDCFPFHPHTIHLVAGDFALHHPLHSATPGPSVTQFCARPTNQSGAAALLREPARLTRPPEPLPGTLTHLLGDRETSPLRVADIDL